ncbi:hypothetical protein ACDX66_24710 [Peribacillus frigoritolerans]
MLGPFSLPARNVTSLTMIMVYFIKCHGRRNTAASVEIYCHTDRNTAAALEFTAIQIEIQRLRSNLLPYSPKYGGFSRIFCLTARNMAAASNNWLPRLC